MHIICPREELQKGVSIVSKAVSNKTTMPILECILIQTKEGRILMTANDMELGIETEIHGIMDVLQLMLRFFLRLFVVFQTMISPLKPMELTL